MRTRYPTHAAVVVVFLFSVLSASAQEKQNKVSISGAIKDKDGILIHDVESPYQKGKTQILVLTPDRMEDGKKFAVVYVLPVEPGNGARWGNPLLEIKKLNLHNRLGVIFVMPTFSDWPWYCDHPTDPDLRQETYFIEVVVAFVEKTYPVLPGAQGRLLLGFSKSGWGAFSLLLRHPDFFGKAAAWDAPLNMAAPNQFGTEPIFGTQANFEKYRVSSLLTSEAAKLKTGRRVAIIGYDNFRPHHLAIHEQMTRLDIPHHYVDVRQGKHDWRSGWLEDAVRFLVPPATGPWNLDDLRKAPTVEWLDKEGSLRKLLYESEPYKGKPTRVFAYYAQPEKIDGKLPAMVLIHGGGGTAFAEWAKLWAKRGYVALAMDLAGHGEKRQRLPDGGPDQDDPSRFDRHDLKDMWTYHAVAAVIRGHSLLRSLPQVDAERIGVTGISWGGYLTCIVAGLDDRFKVAVPVYGCGFIHENSVWLPTFARMPDDWRKTWIENFEPSKYLGQARMPMLFVNGTNDFAYPLDSYRKSYRLVKNRNLCIKVNMPHGHPQGWAPEEIGLFVDQHVKGGKALFRFDDLGVRFVQKDGSVGLAIPQKYGIKAVSIHWTTDVKGPWPKRKWESLAAKNMIGNATDQWLVNVPKDRPLIYFLTATDERGATVSSEHVVVE